MRDRPIGYLFQYNKMTNQNRHRFYHRTGVTTV